MRAILICQDNIKDIGKAVTRQKFREIKRLLTAMKSVEDPLFFIPEYEFPETKKLPRFRYVNESYLREKFDVGAHIDDTPWIRIMPKAQFRS